VGIRDLHLLDLIDAQPRVAFDGAVWRVVREGRDPTAGRASGGRWDPGVFDVLTTSLARDGALSEIHYHLSLQPVFPSKVRFVAHELKVAATANLVIADVAALGAYGVDAATYGARDYKRSQEIGDAAFFLGFDGLRAPSARGPFQNLVLFTERFAPEQIEPARAEPLDWAALRKPKH